MKLKFVIEKRRRKKLVSHFLQLKKIQFFLNNWWKVDLVHHTNETIKFAGQSKKALKLEAKGLIDTKII